MIPTIQKRLWHEGSAGTIQLTSTYHFNATEHIHTPRRWKLKPGTSFYRNLYKTNRKSMIPVILRSTCVVGMGVDS